MTSGVVKWFNLAKGYGFIAVAGSQDVFVHHTGILGEGFRSLAKGQPVIFRLEWAKRGPQARETRPA
ncbi:cold-shock protein [Streptacidiphilus rugosus]|uniref:cold-shock protein n=1 Tax=Streptacidiphilus rugosus TaxID=405783 RepID=UPI00055BE332|nr:cold shock domain-containing protein [Streptacidiphilus rugosus]